MVVENQLKWQLRWLQAPYTSEVEALIDYSLQSSGAWGVSLLETSSFTFLECILLDHKAPKEKTRIGHLMAQLQHTMQFLCFYSTVLFYVVM